MNFIGIVILWIIRFLYIYLPIRSWMKGYKRESHVYMDPLWEVHAVSLRSSRNSVLVTLTSCRFPFIVLRRNSLWSVIGLLLNMLFNTVWGANSWTIVKRAEEKGSPKISCSLTLNNFRINPFSFWYIYAPSVMCTLINVA